MITDFNKIKERVQKRSKLFWGIEEHQSMDPIIELILDVFSYELSKIHQEIEVSDGILLERLAKILVKDEWVLPSPSHALLQVQPIEVTNQLNIKSHFYIQKMIQGDHVQTMYFTPIFDFKAIQASVVAKITKQKCIAYDENHFVEVELNPIQKPTVKENSVWIGIKLHPEILEKEVEIPVCILPQENELTSLFSLINVFDADGNKLPFQKRKTSKKSSNEHYFDNINRHYQDYLYTIDTKKHAFKTESIEEKWSKYFDVEEIEDFAEPLIWLEFQFPIAFETSYLNNIDISLNTFPVVNRKHGYKQHEVKKNGKIISLLAKYQEHFLNVDSLNDDHGRTYDNTMRDGLSNLEGTYTVFYGDIQRFDKRNAKIILQNVIQKVREEGSAFSAMGYDLLNTYLDELIQKIDVLDQKIQYEYKSIDADSEQLFLQTIPHKNTAFFECHYWESNGEWANNIKKNTILNQYQSSGLQVQSIRLKTSTVGGLLKNRSNDKINSLRYGLISKDRIVSNEDIKGFLKNILGKKLSDLEIKSGTMISKDPKKGIVRTVDVTLKLNNDIMLEEENKNRLSHYLTLELAHRSVHQIPYQLKII
ncbi:type VI secretion system baseplate subunit TssF [Aureivirga marina]|uniref:type VI secretion system baseplate subunit TssF n=1 Tax=Aureivirga marina TaxID=1182451 RepID=UPI0018CBA1E7|nr:type VI secretion system baseplate subunit TssF [Aureivirga marina]